MSEHTPEWTLDETTFPPTIRDGHGNRIVEFGFPLPDENARRVLACVRACKGLSTEALESGALHGLLVKIANTEENDEIRGALDRLMEGK